MKKTPWSAIAALAAALGVALGLGILAPATAAPDGPASYVQLTRVPATSLVASSGAYTDLSSTSKWSIQNEAGGYTFDADGITVPVAGVYQLEWSTILVNGGKGIVGFALNGDTPDGGILHAIGPVTSLAASVGNGSTVLPLQPGETIKLWGYGSGGTMSFQDAIAVRWSVTLIDEL